MATRFEAKIKLGNMKRAPLTYVGFRGRTLKKGDSFTTTNPEEAAYYQAQPGFSVAIKKGKLAAAKPAKVRLEPEPEEVDDEEESDDEDDEERDGEVDGAYEKADLKKLKVEELKALIEDDEDLPLSVDDLPKKAGKKEIIEAILEAQDGGEDDEEEDDDEG